ncbi:hypothetical protein Tco_1037887 [Tanacetum coccineum]
MVALRYRDEHNKVGYLQKPTGSDDHYQILDFLRASHIRYALTNDPIIFGSLVKQFWSTATLRSPELGPPAILATIDETPYTIIEDSVRRQLQLADDGGIDDLPIAEIYSVMDNLGYVTEGKLTFYKNKFLPQWRFLVHTILHCLSTKSGSWDQFGSSLAVALIYLSDGRKFNWSSYIFKGMLLFKAHKKLFKDVVGKFVKKVKAIEVKLKTKKRKVVVSDSDQEEGGEQAVDFDALIALANAAVTVDSNIPPGGASNNPAASSHIPTDVPTGGDFAPTHSTSPSRDPFKGKCVAKPSSPVSERTKKQLAYDEDSKDEAPILWSAFAGWEDLLKLYGLVVKYYENHHVAGAGLVLWGDLQVLMDSQEDVSYPLSVKLMERMLKHKLEIDKDVAGNDMTTAEQLIRFLKNQIAAAQGHSTGQCLKYQLVEMVCNPPWEQPFLGPKDCLAHKQTAMWYVVPTGKDNFIVSAGRPNMVPAGRTIVSPGSIIFGRAVKIYLEWDPTLYHRDIRDETRGRANFH